MADDSENRLFEAIEKEDKELVQEILQTQKIDINCKDKVIFIIVFRISLLFFDVFFVSKNEILVFLKFLLFFFQYCFRKISKEEEIFFFFSFVFDLLILLICC